MDNANHVLRPLQVVLSGNQFHKKPIKPAGGKQKDFFAGDNAGFVRHKESIRGNLKSFAQSLTNRSEPVGFLHVRMRETALAKSHRPLDKLFVPKNHISLIGGDEDGNLIVHGSPRAFEELGDLIEDRAEATPRARTDKRGVETEAVSEFRSELGAIEEIRLHDRDDRLMFEPSLALETLRRKDAIGSYVIDLFRVDKDIVGLGAVERLIARFLEALGEIPGGLEIRPVLPDKLRSQMVHPTQALSIRLLRDPFRRLIELPSEIAGPPRQRATLNETHGPRAHAASDLDAKRHEDLLSLLSEQSLVRAVHLPVILDEGTTQPVPSARTVTFSKPVDDYDYPVVGVLDGGVANVAALTPWISGSAGQVPTADRNERHGTFIAGLCAGAYQLNGNIAKFLEGSGAKIFDLDLFPRKDLRSIYYPDYQTFFDRR